MLSYSCFPTKDSKEWLDVVNNGREKLGIRKVRNIDTLYFCGNLDKKFLE
jgi:hypothetical protein